MIFPEASKQAIMLKGELALAKSLEADEKEKQRKGALRVQAENSTRDAGKNMPLDSEGSTHIPRDKAAANVPHSSQGEAPERASGNRLPDDGGSYPAMMHSPYPMRSSSPEPMSESEVLEKIDADKKSRKEQEVTGLTGLRAQTKESARGGGENIRNAPRPEHMTLDKSLQDNDSPDKRIINVPSPATPSSPSQASLYAPTSRSTVTSMEEAMAMASDTRSVNSGGSRRSVGSKSTTADFSRLPISVHGLQTGGFNPPIVSPRSASSAPPPLVPKSRNSRKSNPPLESIKISKPVTVGDKPPRHESTPPSRRLG